MRSWETADRERHSPEERRGRAKPRVAFAYPIDATFVRSDLSLLQTFSEVVPIFVDRRSQWNRLAREIGRSDVVFSWFALGFAAAANIVAKIVGARSILAVGGWDVVSMPEIGYGRLLTSSGRLQSRYALSSAELVLAFSNWSREMVRRISPRARVQTAYLGVDTDRFAPGSKEEIVVCTAHISHENMGRKGLRAFVRAAKEIPEAEFVLVGRHWDDAIAELRGIAPPNMSFPGYIPDDDLRGLLGRAKVYVQPSYTEGFGMALAEAMSAGCVPVVTSVGALPEVVGDVGFYVGYNDHLSLVDGIRHALASNAGERARARILERFTLSHRLSELRNAVLGQSAGGSRRG